MNKRKYQYIALTKPGVAYRSDHFDDEQEGRSVLNQAFQGDGGKFRVDLEGGGHVVVWDLAALAIVPVGGSNE